MSDAEFANHYLGLLTEARHAVDEGRMPNPNGQFSLDMDGCWSALALWPGKDERLADMVVEAGIEWKPEPILGNDVQTMVQVVHRLVAAAESLANYYRTKESNRPIIHARDSLRRSAEYISALRDKSQVSFIFRVMGKFDSRSADIMIGREYASILLLARAAGDTGAFDPPKPCQSLADWIFAWDVLQRLCQSVVAPAMNTAAQVREKKGGRPQSAPIRDLLDKVDEVYPPRKRPVWRVVASRFMADYRQLLLDAGFSPWGDADELRVSEKLAEMYANHRKPSRLRRAR